MPLEPEDQRHAAAAQGQIDLGDGMPEGKRISADRHAVFLRIVLAALALAGLTFLWCEYRPPKPPTISFVAVRDEISGKVAVFCVTCETNEPFSPTWKGVSYA